MKYPNEKLQPSIEPLEISKSQLFSQEWPINMKGSERESLFQKSYSTREEDVEFALFHSYPLLIRRKSNYTD